MKYSMILVLLCISVLITSTHASSPYTTEVHRPIKSLSSERIEALLEGKGLGYAKAAELNGYPGPKHVLELAQDLSLTTQQKVDTEQLFKQMQRDAQKLGSQLIEAERLLDQQLAKGEASEATINSSLEEISEIEGALRFAHMRAHLKQSSLLTRHQIHQYNQLRGYTSAEHANEHAH